MMFEEYTQGCLKTWGGDNKAMRSILGLVGESGEVAEKLKKYLRGDYTIDELIVHLEKELGDVLYYYAMICHEFTIDPEEVMKANLDKLADRQKRGVIQGCGDER